MVQDLVIAAENYPGHVGLCGGYTPLMEIVPESFWIMLFREGQGEGLEVSYSNQ